MLKLKNIKIETTLLLLILLFGLIVRVFFWSKFGDFTWDEGSHSLSGILIARSILNGFDYNYFKEFTNHYWASTGSLFFFPWGYTILTTLSYLLFGFSELAARLPSMFFSLLSIVAIYLLSKKLFNKHIALLSAYFMAINPYFITRGGAALVDIPMTGLIILAFYFCLLALEKPKIKYWALSGLFIGLAGLMKPTGFIIYPFLLLIIIYYKGFRYLLSKEVFIFTTIFVTCFFSYFGIGLLSLFVFPKIGLITSDEGLVIFKSIFQWFGRMLPAKYFELFGKNLIHASYGDPNWQNLSGWLFYIKLLPEQLGSKAMAIISLIGVIFLYKNKKREFYITTFFIIYIYLLFTFIANKDPRYTIPLIPFILILSAVGIFYLYKSIKNKYLRIFSTLILLTLLTFLSIYSTASLRFNRIGNNLQASVEAITKLDSGIIAPFYENNIVNVQTISFYIAINDPTLKFSVLWPDALDIADYIVAQEETEIHGFKTILINNRFHLLPKTLIFYRYKK